MTTAYWYDNDNEMFAVVWKDNNNVKFMSNHQDVNPNKNVKRWSRQKKKEVAIQQPRSIANCNESMGGVDKMDWHINKYRIKILGKMALSNFH